MLSSQHPFWFWDNMPFRKLRGGMPTHPAPAPQIDLLLLFTASRTPNCITSSSRALSSFGLIL